jgi:hypothetical protein
LIPIDSNKKATINGADIVQFIVSLFFYYSSLGNVISNFGNYFYDYFFKLT